MSEGDHLGGPKVLEEWLEANVLVIPEPRTVMLFNFDLNWSKWSGQFKLRFDDFELNEWVALRVSDNGRMRHDLPTFTSPLNVPATFSAVRLTEMTNLAIEKGLNYAFPRLKPLGKNRQSGIEINHSTPISERISERQIEAAIQLVNEDYAISVRLEDL